MTEADESQAEASSPRVGTFLIINPHPAMPTLISVLICPFAVGAVPALNVIGFRLGPLVTGSFLDAHVRRNLPLKSLEMRGNLYLPTYSAQTVLGLRQ